MREFASFNKDFVTWALEQKKAGRTVDEAVAAYKTPGKYVGYAVPQPARLKTNTQMAYDGK
jgi:hypothetical protein